MTALVPLYSFVGAQWNALPLVTFMVAGTEIRIFAGKCSLPTYPTQKPEFQEIETVTSLFLPEVKPDRRLRSFRSSSSGGLLSR